jgi:hypothetical protein
VVVRALLLRADLGGQDLRGVRLQRVLRPHSGPASSHVDDHRPGARPLDLALWTRAKDGQHDLCGLVHHADAGSQHTSIAFTERLLEAGVDASVGSVGERLRRRSRRVPDRAHKTELINPDGPCRDREHVEMVTLDWVYLFNSDRPHESIDELTSDQVEQIHHTNRSVLLETSLTPNRVSGLAGLLCGQSFLPCARPRWRASPLLPRCRKRLVSTDDYEFLVQLMQLGQSAGLQVLASSPHHRAELLEPPGHHRGGQARAS